MMLKRYVLPVNVSNQYGADAAALSTALKHVKAHVLQWLLHDGKGCSGAVE